MLGIWQDIFKAIAEIPPPLQGRVVALTEGFAWSCTVVYYVPSTVAAHNKFCTTFLQRPEGPRMGVLWAKTIEENSHWSSEDHQHGPASMIRTKRM